MRFGFSPDWAGFVRTAVFRAGGESRSVVLDGDWACAIPWEVLEQPRQELFAGVYGTQGGETVLPTVWASLGVILEGAAVGENAQLPTPDVWEQQLARKGDALAYDGLCLSLLSGDAPLSTVQITGGGSGTQGPPGPPGPQGPKGDPGAGVPAGGSAGQVLAKASAADNDTHWADPPGVSMEQVNSAIDSAVTGAIRKVYYGTGNAV